jgi:hypothetical protein
MKKILVIVGLHGNEPLGIEVVQELQKNPVPGVTAIFGNPAAIRTDSRFIEKDLNRVFPGKSNGNVEERRALEIIKIARGCDIVLDFHNTHTPGNDPGFVGGTKYERYLPIAASLGLERVIVADYDCVNKYVTGCISVEISLSSPLCNASEWIKRIKALATDTLEQKPLPRLFRFVRRVSSEEQERFQFKDWEAFKAIPDQDRMTLGLSDGQYFPIFVNGVYTPESFSGLIMPM